MKRFPFRKDPLGGHDHLHYNIVALRLKELSRASQRINRKISLRHLPRGSLDLIDMDPALDRTHPENLPPSHRLHRLVRPPHCLIDSPSRPGRVASETRRNVQNHTDVAIDLFLVSNDFVWFYSYLAILEDLIGARIRSNAPAETQSLVNIRRFRITVASLQEIRVGHQGIDSGLLEEFRLQCLVVRIQHWEHVRGGESSALGLECPNST